MYSAVALAYILPAKFFNSSSFSQRCSVNTNVEHTSMAESSHESFRANEISLVYRINWILSDLLPTPRRNTIPTMRSTMAIPTRRISQSH